MQLNLGVDPGAGARAARPDHRSQLRLNARTLRSRSGNSTERRVVVATSDFSEFEASSRATDRRRSWSPIVPEFTIVVFRDPVRGLHCGTAQRAAVGPRGHLPLAGFRVRSSVGRTLDVSAESGHRRRASRGRMSPIVWADGDSADSARPSDRCAEPSTEPAFGYRPSDIFRPTPR